MSACDNALMKVTLTFTIRCHRMDKGAILLVGIWDAQITKGD